VLIKFKFVSNLTKTSGALQKDPITFILLKAVKKYSIVRQRKGEQFWGFNSNTEELYISDSDTRVNNRKLKAPLFFHGNNGYTNESQCHILRTLSALFALVLYALATLINPYPANVDKRVR
jgi:hypothetical protein